MNNKQFAVSGIGNAIMDLQVELSFEEFKTYGLESGSMNLVDEETFNKISDQLGSTKEVKISSGGSGANTCVALAALGNNVSYGCIVADDSMGVTYERELAELGVKLYNDRISNAVTGKSLLMITPDAERTMNTFLGVTQTFGSAHVNEEIIANSSWLYVEGYLFSTEDGRKSIERAIEIAQKSNTKIAITCSDGFIVEFFRDAVLEACNKADLIFANKNEALKLTQNTDENKALEDLLKLADAAVITLSDKGAIAASKTESVKLPSFKVKAVDDTGAGDMFAAGFLDIYLKGGSLEDSVKQGSYLASRVVSQFGARLNEDLKKLMSSSEDFQKNNLSSSASDKHGELSA